LASKLSHSNAKVQLVIRDDLDHQLDDSAARTAMLRKIDASCARVARPMSAAP
jgi:hypothetical protein